MPAAGKGLSVIDAALQHLAVSLNEFLSRGLGLAEDIAVVSPLTELDGTPVAGLGSKLIVFLAGIEREYAVGGASSATGSGWMVRRAAPVHLNLSVMIAASFEGKNYLEALRMISAAILYFQKNPVFDHQSHPGLDARIERLTLEIENLDRQDLNNLWGVLNAKYVPSVLYKVRMVSFDSQDIRSLEPTVHIPRANLRG